MRTSSEPDLATALPRSFYERPVERVARGLLGSLLVRVEGDEVVGGRIVETEAYGGPGDPGSHADRAPNGRARIMFGPAGIAYVYFTYGMHHCMNAVTGAEGMGSAVLIRALEPLFGLPRMRIGAPANLPDHKVASGPGRVCRALGVTRELNGSDLTSGRLRIVKGKRPRHVHAGVRVGLTLDDGREWRFWADSPSVSSRPIRTKA